MEIDQTIYQTIFDGVHPKTIPMTKKYTGLCVQKKNMAELDSHKQILTQYVLDTRMEKHNNPLPMTLLLRKIVYQKLLLEKRGNRTVGV